jgi:hypothetical protein
MARFAAAFAATGIGSTTLPMGSLYATATCRPRLVEVHVTNTSTTLPVTLNLTRLTTAGTQGAAITETYEDDNSQANVAQAVNTHTVAPTLGGVLRRATLPATGGVMWTAGGGKTPGWIIPNTTGDGIGVILATGTGQICDLVFVWDE